MEDKPTTGPVEESLDSTQPAPLPGNTPAAKPPTTSRLSSPNALVGRLKNTRNLYLFIFGFLVLICGLAVFGANKLQNKNSPNKAASSLSPEELAQLKGNTTVVGDAKQTLDIQSNAVFEGQILTRSDLNVAGATKIGGNLSAASLSVNGDVTFGQLQLNNALSVNGSASLAGGATVQKGLTVSGNGSFTGSLSAGSLTTGNLQFSGDLTINRHITLGGAAPGKTNGTALGSGGTVSVNGNDTAGTITINTGSSPPAGSFVTVNFASRFNATPHVVVSPVGSGAAGLQYYVTRTTSGFTLSCANAPPAGTSFAFDYIVID